MGKVKREAGEFGLCGTCVNALITETASGQKIVRCLAADCDPIVIREKIVNCTRHATKNEMTKWELARIAWIITTDEKKEIGFARPGTKEHGKLYGRIIEEMD